MPFYELMRLHKHAAGAAGWVINSALIRLNDFHDEFNNAGWRKKFAPTRAIRKREFPEEVFVDSPESITLNIVWNLIEVFEKRDYGSVIKFLKCLRENTDKLFIFRFNLFHRVIHGSAHIRSFRQFYKIGETSFFRDKQHTASMVIGRRNRPLARNQGATIIFGFLFSFFIQLMYSFRMFYSRELKKNQTQNRLGKFIEAQRRIGAHMIRRLPQSVF